MGAYSHEIDFIRTLFASDDFIPLHAATFAGNEKTYLNECIDTTFVSSVGEFVNRFEREVAEFTGAKRAVVCVSGTNALHMALILVGVQPTDEVITQPLTFVATANAIAYCGASPIFIDVDLDTMGLSPVKMGEWLQVNAKMVDGRCVNKHTKKQIKACVPMHTFGHPVHLDALVSICKEWNITLVEDAAESIGSYYKGRHTGTVGPVGILSFNGNKTITTGGGGMLLFNDEKLADYCKHISTQAKIPHRWEFRHDNIGYNYRMPNINAALGCAQMEELPRFLKSKRETAQAYKEHFTSHPSIKFMAEPYGTVSNYWLCAALLPSKKERNRFLEQTNDAGVMTRPIWELMNRLPMYSGFECGDLTNAEFLADRIVNLPSSVRI